MQATSITNNQLIRTWENCYQVSLGNLSAYKRRLKELTTWDKPLDTPANDPGRWREWSCKKVALEGLITEYEN